jgi:hypothetical protein
MKAFKKSASCKLTPAAGNPYSKATIYSIGHLHILTTNHYLPPVMPEAVVPQDCGESSGWKTKQATNLYDLLPVNLWAK